MDIKDEVINNKLTYNELLELYIKYLRKKLDKQSNIPSFDKDYNYYMKNSDCNCYCYALRLKIPKYFSKAFYKTNGIVFDIDPGVFCGINDISTANKLVEALYGDLDTLKIDYKKVLDNNHLYKIALYQDSFNNNASSIYPPDYHFWRQNSDGSWSCKQGYEGIVEKSYIHTPNRGHKLVRVLDINR